MLPPTPASVVHSSPRGICFLLHHWRHHHGWFWIYQMHELDRGSMSIATPATSNTCWNGSLSLFLAICSPPRASFWWNLTGSLRNVGEKSQGVIACRLQAFSLNDGKQPLEASMWSQETDLLKVLTWPRWVWSPSPPHHCVHQSPLEV